MSRRNWERVQVIERRYHAEKDTSRVLPVNLEYWKRILGALPEGLLAIDDNTRSLDVGCGGAGILLGVGRGKRVGLDPLMGYYLEKFPFLREQDVEWREGMAEDLAAGEQYDVIFGINMLDHVALPEVTAANLVRLLAPGGRLVILLNTHLERWSRAYFAATYRFIDPPHPHHFHRDDVPAFFPGTHLVHQQDADHLWLDLKGHYDENVRHRGAASRWRRLALAAVNPFKYPLAAARFLLGRPVHRRRVTDNPLIAATLYVLVKDGAATP